MTKARIVKTTVGVKTYYYPQIQTRYMFFFKRWEDIAGVSLMSGHVSWYRSLGSEYGAQKILRNFEELFGIKLEIVNE